MNEAEVLDIAREAIWVLIKVSLPLMMVALFVGLVVSLVQALTQIQEMTLAFVPKIMAVFIASLLFLPFMMRSLIIFTEMLFDKMIALS